VIFRVLTMYKRLNGLTLAYLADDCLPVSSVASRRHLRSTDARKLAARRIRTVLDTRDFAVSSTVVWDCLLTVL